MAAAKLRVRVAYPAFAALALAANPAEGFERVREKLAARREPPVGGLTYRLDDDWERKLHELLGAPWPCSVRDEGDELWAEAVASLRKQGLTVGRGVYAGWDDADPALARTAWCLVRHLRPEQVVETGVARGLSTRVVLEAFERNGRGRLWSIDLPPLIEKQIAKQIGAAVPERLRDRWTYVNGSSRRRLPRLLADLGAIDVFIHDSLHTARNVCFELEHAWRALRPNGFALVDDINYNLGFRSFTQGRHAVRTIIGRSDDRQRLLGIIRKEASAA